jgi:hypothetical protein
LRTWGTFWTRLARHTGARNWSVEWNGVNWVGRRTCRTGVRVISIIVITGGWVIVIFKIIIVIVIASLVIVIVVIIIGIFWICLFVSIIFIITIFIITIILTIFFIIVVIAIFIVIFVRILSIRDFGVEIIIAIVLEMLSIWAVDNGSLGLFPLDGVFVRARVILTLTAA